MIRVVCGCGRVFKAEQRHSGKRTRCPVCGANLVIGQTPASSSDGDLDEVPSWWYPSDPRDPFADGGSVPVENGDPELVRTAILPAVPTPGIAAERGPAVAPSAPGDGPVADRGVQVVTAGESGPLSGSLVVVATAVILGLTSWMRDRARARRSDSGPAPQREPDPALRPHSPA